MIEKDIGKCEYMQGTSPCDPINSLKNLGIVGSVWKLKVPLYSPYTMFPTCLQVPRPIRTGSGNILVFGVQISVALAIENALVEITPCMHNEIEGELNEDVGGILLGFV